MSIKRRIDRAEGEVVPRPTEPCEPYGAEWIDRADALLRGMSDEQAERVLRDLLSGGHSRLARAFTSAAVRGLTFAEGGAL